MRPRLQADPSIRANRAHPLAEPPVHRRAEEPAGRRDDGRASQSALSRSSARSVPVRVLRRYGWAHSFLLERQPVGARGEPGGDVRAPVSRDAAGRAVHRARRRRRRRGRGRRRVDRLEALGCLRANTVLVHGVAIDAGRLARMRRERRRASSGARRRTCSCSAGPRRCAQLLDASRARRARICASAATRA